MIFHQAKTGKHECGKIAATYTLVLNNFHQMKGHVTLFQRKAIMKVSFLFTLYVFISFSVFLLQSFNSSLNKTPICGVISWILSTAFCRNHNALASLMEFHKFISFKKMFYGYATIVTH